MGETFYGQSFYGDSARDPVQTATKATGKVEAQHSIRTTAQKVLDSIINEATLLQRMCDGQAANIRTMSGEADELRGKVDQLREMNGKQFATIVQLRQELQSELQSKVSRHFMDQLHREAAYGRKMAAAAGTNIA